MSFTIHFLYDVFISYASANNAPPQLITAFHEQLISELRGLGAGEGLDVFFDQGDIDDGKPISDQLLTAARSSAVMIAFHSPAYDRSSEWCQREFYEFREAREAGRVWEDHFFLVSLNRDLAPAASSTFGAFPVRHHRSFFQEKAGGWFPFRPDRPAMTNPEGLTLSEEVFHLARQVVTRLQALRDAAPIRKVFLTCASESFKAQAAAIKTDLTAQGFHVLQTSPWIEPARRREDAARLIAQADLVIGIEENFTEGDEAGEHAAEQLAIARQPGRARPELRWLPREARTGFSAEEEAARKQRPEMRAVPLEEFKKMAVALLRAPVIPAMPASFSPANGEPASEARQELVLLVCSPDDETQTLDQMLAILDQLPAAGRQPIGYDSYPDFIAAADSANVDVWCQSIKERLKAVSATRVLFLDGRCSRDWIDDRLRRFIIMQRELQLPGAVCDCDPLNKPHPRRFRPRNRIGFLRFDDPAQLKAWIFS